MKILEAGYVLQASEYDCLTSFLFWGANVHPGDLFVGLLSSHAILDGRANVRDGLCPYTENCD